MRLKKVGVRAVLGEAVQGRLAAIHGF